MDEQWYIYSNQQQEGPYTREEIIEQVQEGKLKRTDLVWQEGMAEWKEAEQVEGLLPVQPVTPPPPPNVVSPPPPPAKVIAPPPPPGPAVQSKQQSEYKAGQPKKKMSGLKLAAIIGGSLLVLYVVIIIIALSAARGALRSSEIYNQAIAYAQSSPEAVRLLGEPIEAGKSVNGSIDVSNGSGNAELTIPLTGSISKGELFATGVRNNGVWSLTSLELVTDSGESANLMAGGLDFGSPGVSVTPPSGMLTFNEPGYGFTMNYPQNWTYEIVDNFVYFYGPEGTDEGENMIIVQILASSAVGGLYANLEELYADLEGQYNDLNGLIYNYDSGSDYIGDTIHDYIIAGVLYDLDGEEIMELAMLIERDSEYFYLLVYTVPSAIGEQYLDLVFDNIIETFRFTAF